MHNRKKGTLEISLKSDLCAGSGYSYAGIVDSDICHDEWGIPYIPAKRIKGCLRETAEQILYSKYDGKQVEELFGSAGEKNPSDLFLGNAYIENYNNVKTILCEKKEDGNAGRYYDTQSILEQFTTVVGQTSMDEGAADPSTLRYTRVVNRFSPMICNRTEHDKGEMVFCAEISCQADMWEMLENAVKGTRHIGLKRNRGMGNICCKLIPDQEGNGSGRETQGEDAKLERSKDWIYESDLPDEKVRLTYSIKNIEPLMMSARQENRSEGYIPGQVMLGCLASRYLSGSGKSAYMNDEKTEYEEEFKDLFLNGKTIFTNLYPAKGGKVYYPAPEYINKLKKTGKLVNTIEHAVYKCSGDGDRDYDTGGGNLPKKLKGKFVALSGNKVSVHEVKKDIVYHHSHTKKNESGQEGLLYGMEILRQGQVFEGGIILDKKYVDILKALLVSGDFYLGKSKSSQYGRCQLTEGRKKEDRLPGNKIPAGHYAVVTFLSNTILLDGKDRDTTEQNGTGKDEEGQDGTGRFQVYFEEVKEAVKTALKLKETAEAKEEKDYTACLQTTTATGYMGTWNLRKDAVPAVRAGSCLVYCIGEEFPEGIYFIGERNAEGYGQVLVEEANTMKYMLEEMEEAEEQGDEKGKEGNEAVKNLLKPILLKSFMEKKKLAALKREDQKKQKKNISNTANGRYIFMLTESVSESDGDMERAFQNFGKRIDSIKSEDARSQGRKLLKEIGVEKEISKDKTEWYLKTGLGFWNTDKQDIGGFQEEELSELKNLGFLDDEIDQMVKEQWDDYLMTILVNRKYEGRSE